MNIKLSHELSDLKQCEKEPLNFIGSVQTHGALIAFTLPDQRIQSASENIGDFIKTPHADVIASKISNIFGIGLADHIVKQATTISKGHRISTSFEIQLNDQSLSAYLYVSEDLYCLEIEKTKGARESIDEIKKDQQVLKECLVQLRNSEDLYTLGSVVCRAVRAVTGIDRVMLYRFLPPNWHGEVIAEDRVVHSHSYFQHRFPASDIPRIARDLYLRNSVRMIPDVTAAISKVSPEMNPKTKKAIDLSDSRLRAVSPIHLEYLRNMKVGASYSFAIIVNNELWGLVACHHLAPLHIGASQRQACELIANAFSAQAPLLERVHGQQHRISFDIKLRSLIESARNSNEPINDLIKSHQILFDTFSCTGLAYIANNTVDLAGLCPPASVLSHLTASLRTTMDSEGKKIAAFTNMASVFPEWKNLTHTACGLLALKINGPDQGLLLFFRPETIETIIWGGDPRKQLDRKGFEGRINPRESFETWTETISGHSKEWLRFEIEGAQFLKDTVFETFHTNQKLIHELTTRLQK